MKSRSLVVMTILALLLATSMVTVVQAAEPEVVRLFDIQKDETGHQITKVIVVVYSCEEGVFYVSLSGTIQVVKYGIGTLKVTINYRGTTTSPIGGEFINGKMTYSLASTGDVPMGNGHWVVWYEDGLEVRKIGSGEFWLP